MNSPMDKLIDTTMIRYGLPGWVRPYIHRYVRDSPVSAVRFAISLIDTKRKKGSITKTQVKLPNGKALSMGSVLKLLGLFFHGEENISRAEIAWANSSADRNAIYEARFAEMAEIDAKRARAIKNLAEGLGHAIGECPKSMARTFERIAEIEDWRDRIVATGIIVKYAYAATFGTLFYRVFYPVSPEFMRFFGKAFDGDDKDSERWDTAEARRMLEDGSLDSERVLGLSRELLVEILRSMESNMDIAKELGLEKEVMLLSEISVAYPFEVLSEMGVKVDIDDEVKRIKKLSSA
ncbi:MAG: hypothetical protein ACREBH_01965 [Candidatus Micrarchaeaceae archaeon]